MSKHGPSQEQLGRGGPPMERSSESKLENASSKLSILNRNQTKNRKGLSAVTMKHSATSVMDSRNDVSFTINPHVQQFKSTSPKSYQEAKDELKEIPPKKPIKLAPLALSEEVKKAQLEKLKYIQIEGKQAAEKLVSTGKISTEHHPKKEQNHERLDNLKTIKLAEKANLENQNSPKHLLLEVPFLRANISNSISHQTFKSPLPSKPLFYKTTNINAKSVVSPDEQKYIPEENLVPSLHPVQERIKIKHKKDYDNGTHDKP
ncbi:uncharacterized protein LOC125452007 [Stegostoma tigrinum]|uniref:uncharacterized protein LOC125452007 n=1 Tax=Stegostoma tigrinum TaxID=3053191 RepID=UPI00202B3E45|nr:uncharacterized protein LOC125452007 [Stegostoma tigrinum]